MIDFIVLLVKQNFIFIVTCIWTVSSLLQLRYVTRLQHSILKQKEEKKTW